MSVNAYHRKTKIVKAKRLTPPPDPAQTMGLMTLDEIRDELESIAAWAKCRNPPVVGRTTYITLNNGDVVHRGDWVVEESWGSFVRMSDEEFRAEYDVR